MTPGAVSNSDDDNAVTVTHKKARKSRDKKEKKYRVIYGQEIFEVEKGKRVDFPSCNLCPRYRRSRRGRQARETCIKRPSTNLITRHQTLPACIVQRVRKCVYLQTKT